MSDTISLGDNDVVVSRVSNGWILRIQDETIDGHSILKTHVYEDEQHGRNASAEALACCLWEAFNDYTRSNRSDGITFEVKEAKPD